jgi:hypothetical protein
LQTKTTDVESALACRRVPDALARLILARLESRTWEGQCVAFWRLLGTTCENIRQLIGPERVFGMAVSYALPPGGSASYGLLSRDHKRGRSENRSSAMERMPRGWTMDESPSTDHGPFAPKTSTAHHHSQSPPLDSLPQSAPGRLRRQPPHSTAPEHSRTSSTEDQKRGNEAADMPTRPFETAHGHGSGSRFTRALISVTEQWPLLHGILVEKDSRRILYYMRWGAGRSVHSHASRADLHLSSLNLGFMFVQLVYGWLTGSLGLLSDTVHMFFDCLALAVGLCAAVMGRWPPNERFPYGYGKVESLAGFGNGCFLV